VHRLGKEQAALDAAADRKAGVLRVNAIHEDQAFDGEISRGVQGELDELAAWLGLGSISGPGRGPAGRG
jgi:uncharacterized protein